MAKSKHSKVALDYLQTVLNYTRKCPKPFCKGYLVEVLVRYRNLGPTHVEHECIVCSKIVRSGGSDYPRKNYNKYNKKGSRQYDSKQTSQTNK